jgi:adiponectin receptor
MDEVESVRLNLLENLHTKDYIEAFDEYRAKLINIIESKDFDWIDLYQLLFTRSYRKLSNQSDEEWEKDRNSTHISRWPIVVFLLAAAACMGGSAVFHTFYCISATANKILLRIDYAGICFLIAGSSLPPYYYGFYCQPVYAWLYGGINCVMGSVVFIVSMCDFIHTVEYRPLKGRMYAALGISGAFGGIHLMMTTDDVLQGYEFASWTPYYLLMGVTYLYQSYVMQVVDWQSSRFAGQKSRDQLLSTTAARATSCGI